MRALFWSVIALLLLACAAPRGAAQMVTGQDMAGFGPALGVTPHLKNPPYSAHLTASSVPGNVLWPGERATFRFQLVNNTDRPLPARGRVEVIAYGTRGRPGDVWTPHVFRIAVVGAVSIPVALAPNGFADLSVAPPIPARLGAYALVVDLGPAGRQFLTSCVRTFRATQGRLQYPKFCLDALPVDVLKRLDVHAIRFGEGYKPTADPDFAAWYAREGARLKAYQDADVAVLFMVGGGEFFGPMQPLGRPRPWLNARGVMQDTKFDLAWLPSYDADFERWTRRFATDYGWPKGPINAFSLWNEPWEGISISGWGADMLRYREMYTRMAAGVLAARRSGAQVLVGGCDSSSNAFDKLFPDGKDTFLPIFDFLSIHYQGLDSTATVKKWVNRRGYGGRVRIWDTESWVANTDDRVAALVAGDRAAGYDRAMGIYGGNICAESSYDERLAGGGTRRVQTVTAWPPAAAVGASQHFLGERSFDRLLFRNGLPWVMLFHGLPGRDGRPNPDDGTVVVVGDLGEEFGANSLPFRTARGYAELRHKTALKGQLAALPAGASARQRAALKEQIDTPETLSDATLTLTADPRFHLYDFYGNPVAARGGKIVVPLDGRGFFLRADGTPGSFARLVRAIQSGRIDGIEPLAVVAHDMTAPIAQRPTLRLSLTNVLNRPVRGILSVTLGRLRVTAPRAVSIGPNETREVAFRVTGGAAVASNTYPLGVLFGGDGGETVGYRENMHVNWIARRTITVDGSLDDWRGVLPQPVTSGRAVPTLTEAAWFPFKSFGAGVRSGVATGYLACDDRYFYFAAKIADDTADPGTVRFATRDDDAYFYPQTSYVVRLPHPQTAPARDDDPAAPRPLTWPTGVRRYSYRQDPSLPAGNGNGPSATDNVQIAFNVLPDSAKPWYPYPPGTMPHFIGYKDTDYEYALNQVAPRYGGGCEIWRLAAPGMPHKHFYPRQPKSPYDGPVRGGKLVMRRDGSTRLVECAIPWTELPAVRKRLDAGRTIRFSFRVNDNAPDAGTMELSRGRSVAKRNGSFHADWVEHWANELEFGFGR